MGGFQVWDVHQEDSTFNSYVEHVDEIHRFSFHLLNLSYPLSETGHYLQLSLHAVLETSVEDSQDYSLL